MGVFCADNLLADNYRSKRRGLVLFATVCKQSIESLQSDSRYKQYRHKSECHRRFFEKLQHYAEVAQ